MSGLARFIRLGLLAAERRMGCFRSRVPADDPWVVQTVASSRVVGVLAGVLERVGAAIATSTSSAFVWAVLARWREAGWASQRRALGTILLTATIVHLVLTWWQGPQPGWLWLILPGIAAALGLLLMAASIDGSRRSFASVPGKRAER